MLVLDFIKQVLNWLGIFFSSDEKEVLEITDSGFAKRIQVFSNDDRTCETWRIIPTYKADFEIWVHLSHLYQLPGQPRPQRLSPLHTHQIELVKKKFSMSGKSKKILLVVVGFDASAYSHGNLEAINVCRAIAKRFHEETLEVFLIYSEKTIRAIIQEHCGSFASVKILRVQADVPDIEESRG